MDKLTLPKHTIPYILAILGILVVVLAIIGLIGALISHSPILTVWRVIFGAILVLFMPGFVWSYVFFSRRPERRALGEEPKDLTKKQKDSSLVMQNDKEKPLDFIERITLSIALSMAMGPLLIFFLNRIGVKINLLNSFLELLALIVAGFIAIILLQHQKITK